MKFSEQWLREWVNPEADIDAIAQQITMAGLEVDAIEPVAGQFSDILVAEIISIEQHPDADKLRVCQVAFGGEETAQVVCGAPNARQGLKAPFAKVGAVLPGDFKIKKAKLRGVPSMGMLCGASELGMEDIIDGLMELPSDAPVGRCLRDYLSLNDSVVEVDLTPNRGDCLSLLGLAREVAVLNKLPLTLPKIPEVPAQTSSQMAVDLQALDDCPRYVSRIIEGIDITKPTPLWMVEKLRRSGIRSIDAVVDVTNYVLLELGQPMHAFDKSQLNGSIVVRKAAAKEKLVLLDEQELSLDESCLVIADEQKALALAGIMGGKDSGVNEQTTDIVLESAFFAPEKIAGRARSFGLHTDSSHRFERGVDNQGQERAIERATALLLEIVGGKPGPVSVSGKKTLTAPVVSLPEHRVKQVLGLEVKPEEITDILNRLGITTEFRGDQWQCQVPSYRFDISIEADLIEEIARVYGYNRLPVRQLQVPVNFVKRQEAQTPLQQLKQHLVSRDYQEAITYSFIDAGLQALFSNETPIAVSNPISQDMAVMRDSLLPGLVKAMQHNQKRQASRVRLFESGLSFKLNADGSFLQQPYLAGLITGAKANELWANNTAAVDFYDVKGDVESLLQVAGHNGNTVHFEKAERQGLHPGQCAEVFINGLSLGYVGALHPELLKSQGISGQVFVFELSLSLLTVGNVSQFKALSKFPQVRRDIAIVVDNQCQASDITHVIKQQIAQQKDVANSLLDCSVFDVYTGDNIGEGKKSLALALNFQHTDKSLTDEEIQPLMAEVVEALTQQLGAQLRN